MKTWSNTSLGRGRKGSKFWIQTIVNSGMKQDLDPLLSSQEITWLSPLKQNNYREMKTHELPGIELAHLRFWPDQGPQWDAIGIDAEGILYLIEAKGHPKETITRCKARNPQSQNLIKQSMKETHDRIAPSHSFPLEVWYSTYYQMGNRLAFLDHLQKQGVRAKLILLNLVNDPTHIPTDQVTWEHHYKAVFTDMTGKPVPPDDVLIVYFEV